MCSLDLYFVFCFFDFKIIKISMYISSRAAIARNIAVSAINGLITLIILLIAPLGLAAVIINTLLVTLSSFAIATAGDRITRWLQSSQQAEILSSSQRSQLRRADLDDLERQ